jgi:hypothetical protein
MTERYLASSESMLRTPGTIIEVEDTRHFPLFEDIVAWHVDPDMSDRQFSRWQQRPSIDSLLRPPRFYGRIHNITLEVMPDHFDRYLDAKERGFKFPVSQSVHRMRNEETEAAMRTKGIGFVLLAEASSSRRKDMGQIQAELWYMPVPIRKILKDGSTWLAKETAMSRGATVVRRYTQPIYDRERFIRLQEDAQRVGLMALEFAMKKSQLAKKHL